MFKGLFSSWNKRGQKTQELDKELTIIQEYKEALENIKGKKHGLAEDLLRRVKSVLESANQTETPSYFHLVKRLAQNSIDQNKHSEAEAFLDMGLSLIRKSPSNPEEKTEAEADQMNLLLLHCLKTNPKRVGLTM